MTVCNAEVILNKTQEEYRRSSAMIQSLKNPAAYSHSCTRKIRVIETHSAWVVLTGLYAYKIKKPVNFGFLDFSTLEKRHTFARRELALNKPQAGEIYLKLVEIRGTVASPKVDSDDGAILEYAVMMHEFPDQSLLIDLVAKRQLNEQHIEQLAQLVAAQHRAAKPAPAKSLFGSPQQIATWTFEGLHNVGDLDLTEEAHNTLGFLTAWIGFEHQRLQPHLLERIKNNNIRDCHGDLHLRNLVLIDNKILAFDRIEFNEELRWIDVMSEIAFLLMDLDEHNLHTLANHFINRYLQLSGDYQGLRVLPYYLVYRALVRAKVSVLRRRQLQHHTKAYQAESLECLRYINYAKQCTIARSPKLIICHGVSGSGKSFLAKRVCEKVSAIQIRSDIERKRLMQKNVNQQRSERVNMGIYTQEISEKVYTHLLELAHFTLDAGYSLILDATFLTRRHRIRAREIAAKKSLPFFIVSCTATKATLLERIAHRQASASDPSDADADVLDAQLQNAEQFLAAEEPYVIEVNTEKNSDIVTAIEKIQAGL